MNVTQRFELPVTQRYTQAADRQVSARTGEHPSSADRLGIGTSLAEHYCIIAGPLGGVTGEAEVYHVRDTRSGQAVALKLYHYSIEPKTEVLARMQGLSHPGIVHLHNYDHWAGRFYEVMEFCAGGTLSDWMPFSVEDLCHHLPGINSGLHYCHQQGIIHRDIKPNNLFFRHVQQHEAVIGDFGISSLSEATMATRRVRITQSAANLTLDYAAPELLDGHEVSPQTDYYALGITLLHLFMGQSPFQDKSPTSILAAHLRGDIPLPPGLPPRFRLLIEGLTVLEPARRWGYRQIVSWLKGETVHAERAPVSTSTYSTNRPINPLLAEAMAWEKPVNSNVEKHPFPAFPEAQTPAELALKLTKFDAARALFRGQISRWVREHFDPLLANHIDTLAENHAPAEKHAIALIKLRCLLNPDAPLMIGPHPVSNIQTLADLLTRRDAATRRSLHNVFWSGILEYWLKRADVVENSAALVNRLFDLRQRLNNEETRDTALFALLFILIPQRPLRISRHQTIDHPQAFGKIFRRHPRLIGAMFQKFIFSQRLEEWLRATEFEDWEQDVRFIADVRQQYASNPILGAYVVHWYYQPDFPFPFNDQFVESPQQLVKIIDQNAENWRTGVTLLQTGWIRAWLTGSQQLRGDTAIQAFDQLLLRVDENWDSKLEAVLHLLEPTLAWPQIAVRPGSLAFGVLAEGQVRRIPLEIFNQGRGYLQARIKPAHYGIGLAMDRYTVEGRSQTVVVSIDTLHSEPGRQYASTLHITSNAGETIDVPLSYLIKKDALKINVWSRLFSHEFLQRHNNGLLILLLTGLCMVGIWRWLAGG